MRKKRDFSKKDRRSCFSNDDVFQRRYISVYWKCCHSFSRVYKNREGTAYAGCCPRCRSSLSVPIGEEGTTRRTFIAE